MSLSKCPPEKVENLHLEYETYNFDRNWDTCDYIDPSKLPEHMGKNDLLIVQWNTRGLRGKLDDIESLLNRTLEQKVGIVIINKSWVTNNSPPLPKINGYKYIGKARKNRKGGGVGFLVRDDIIFRRRETVEIANSKCLEKHSD